MRALSLPWLVAALAAAWGLVPSCLNLAWREGIACDGDRCPGALTCCAGRCLRTSACTHGDAEADGAGDALDLAADGASVGTDASDALASDGGPSDGPMVVVCPAEVGGCFACMPGCDCVCGGSRALCCLKFGVASCGGCP